MVSWVFAYVQTHQTVYIKYVQFFVNQLYVTKAVKMDLYLITPSGNSKYT